jgi:hypothetical protein
VKYGVITLSFLLMAGSLSGDPPDQRANSVWLYLYASDSEEAGEIRSIVTTDLTRELEKQGFSILSEQTWRAKLSQEELSSLERIGSSSAVQLAERAEAAIALVGSIEVERNDIVIRIQAYDVLTNNLIFTRIEKESKDIGIYNKVNSLSRELIDTLLMWSESQPDEIGRLQSETSVPEGTLDEQQLRETTPPETERILEPEAPAPGVGEPAGAEMKPGFAVNEQAPVQEEAKIRVTFLSDDEGAEVYLGPDKQAGIIQNGKLVVEVPANTTLAIETKKPGYRVNREKFDLRDQSVEIRLHPLVKTTRFGFELFSTSSQFLGIGAGFRFYVVPDFVLLRADNYFYFSTGSDDHDAPSAFHDDFRLQVGAYLFTPPNRRLRFGMATGIGIILSVLGESTTRSSSLSYFDFYWDLINLWLDFNWDKWAVFCRVETKYALGIGTGLLEPGLLADYGPQFTVGWLRKF